MGFYDSSKDDPISGAYGSKFKKTDGICPICQKPKKVHTMEELRYCWVQNFIIESKKQFKD